MVILRCIGPEGFFHEKVIFPFECWSFQAPDDADVELWCHGIGGAELLERLSSATLQALEPDGILTPFPEQPSPNGPPAAAR